MKWTLIGLTVAAILMPASARICAAQDQQLIIVTGTVREDFDILYDEFGRPGIGIQRTADFAVQAVELINDSRKKEDRYTELRATIDAMLDAAEEDPSIDIAVGDYIVFDLSSSADVSLFELKTPPDTTQATLLIKSPLQNAPADAPTMIKRLKSFIAEAEGFGRTVIELKGELDLTMYSPNQYRDQIIAAMADDVGRITERLGDDYRVFLYGAHNPVVWERVGVSDLFLYIPHAYTIAPKTATVGRRR